MYYCMDDFIIIGSNNAEIGRLSQYLYNQFKLKDLGDMNYFLGIEVKHSGNGDLYLSQNNYIQTVLKRSHMDKAKSLTTLMISNPPLVKE